MKKGRAKGRRAEAGGEGRVSKASGDGFSRARELGCYVRARSPELLVSGSGLSFVAPPLPPAPKAWGTMAGVWRLTLLPS